MTPPGGPAAVIAAADLTKRYPPHVEALAGVSLAVRRGELVAVLEPMQNVLVGRLALAPAWRVVLRRFYSRNGERTA